ncbi:MAG: MBL fold metallo-hydrolase [Oscillospiraceae bacterium]|nr:MBL fold metallo-hydrolase [Oscillospiraceae bacterium]
MIRGLSIGSGSGGNCFYLEINGKRILIDLGLSARTVSAGLRRAGTALEELDAVLITHTHTDHIKGLPVCSKKLTCPLFMSEVSGAKLFSYSPRILPPGRAVEITADIRVTAFETSHDCPGSIGFRIDSPGGSFGYATDLGCMTEEIRETLLGVDSLVLEANHDVEMLRNGPYPYALKRRILSENGHLSNDACAEAAAFFAGNGTERIFLAHLSRENNTPVIAAETVGKALAGLPVELEVLPPGCDGERLLSQ